MQAASGDSLVIPASPPVKNEGSQVNHVTLRLCDLMQNVFVSNLLSVWSLAKKTTVLPDSCSSEFRETCLAETQRLGRLKVWECLGEAVKLTNWSHVTVPRRAVWTNEGDSEVIHLLEQLVRNNRNPSSLLFHNVLHRVCSSDFFFYLPKHSQDSLYPMKTILPGNRLLCCTGSFWCISEVCVCVRVEPQDTITKRKHPV